MASLIFPLQIGIIRSRFHYFTSKSRNSTISGFLKPWNPVFIRFILPKYFKKYMKNHGNILEKGYFPYLNFSEFQTFDIFRKDGHRTMMKIRRRTSWTSWIWDQYLRENMKWIVCKTKKLWNQWTTHKTKTLSNHETLKSRSQSTWKNQ